MSTKFHVACKRRNGNLHVFTQGDFDGNSAWELVNLLHDQYDGQGEVYIDTHELREMCPFGCSTFQCQLNLRRIPAERLFFEGEKGREIAPKGSRVIVSGREHRCLCSGGVTSGGFTHRVAPFLFSEVLKEILP